jgi:hypothetical protein
MPIKRTWKYKVRPGKHTEIYVENGELVRLHRGCHVSLAFKRGSRSAIRKWRSS